MKMEKFGQIVLLVLCIVGILVALLGLCVGVYRSMLGSSNSPSPLGTLIGMVLTIAFWIWILKLLIKGLKNVWTKLIE